MRLQNRKVVNMCCFKPLFVVISYNIRELMKNLYRLLNSYYVPGTIDTINFCSYENHLASKGFHLLKVVFLIETI